MKLKRYNKAAAAMLAGAAATILGTFFAFEGETIGAIQTLLTALLVWFVPNGA